MVMRIIDIPLPVHNLSICEWGDFFLCLASHWENTIPDYINMETWFFILDKNFEIIKGPEKIWLALNECSFCSIENRLLIFGDYWKRKNINRMYFRRIEFNEIRIDMGGWGLKEIPFCSTFREKNWTPFVTGNKIFLIPYLNPFTVLELDEKTGNTTEVSKFSWKTNLSEVHGGTRAVPYSETEYLGVCHSLERKKTGIGEKEIREYKIWIYTFSREPPFKILRFSERPLIESSMFPDVGPARDTWWLDTKSHVFFEHGVVIKDDLVFVSFGVQDFYSKILILSKTELEELLVPIAT